MRHAVRKVDPGFSTTTPPHLNPHRSVVDNLEALLGQPLPPPHGHVQAAGAGTDASGQAHAHVQVRLPARGTQHTAVTPTSSTLACVRHAVAQMEGLALITLANNTCNGRMHLPTRSTCSTCPNPGPLPRLPQRPDSHQDIDGLGGL